MGEERASLVSLAAEEEGSALAVDWPKAELSRRLSSLRTPEPPAEPYSPLLLLDPPTIIPEIIRRACQLGLLTLP